MIDWKLVEDMHDNPMHWAEKYAKLQAVVDAAYAALDDGTPDAMGCFRITSEVYFDLHEALQDTREVKG